MDARLLEAVSYAVSAKLKGSLFEPGETPDMLTSEEIRHIEAAVGHTPLTREELLEAADEYARQLEAAKELIPA